MVQTASLCPPPPKQSLLFDERSLGLLTGGDNAVSRFLHSFHLRASGVPCLVLHWERGEGRGVQRDLKLHGQTLRAGFFQLLGNDRSTHKLQTAHVFSLTLQAAPLEEFQNFLATQKPALTPGLPGSGGGPHCPSVLLSLLRCPAHPY